MAEKAGAEQGAAEKIEAARVAWEKAETERVEGETELAAVAETERLAAIQLRPHEATFRSTHPKGC